MTVSKYLFYSMALGKRSQRRMCRRVGSLRFPRLSPLHLARHFECFTLAADNGFVFQALRRAQLQLDMSFELNWMPYHARGHRRTGLFCSGDIRKFFVLVSQLSGFQSSVE